MKRVLTGIFGLLLLCLVEAYGQPLFQKNYGESSSGFGIEATIQTQDSGFVSTGYWNELVPLADPGQPPFDIYLLKSDQAGRMQWVRGYGRSGDQRGLQVRQHGNKGFYILARDDTAYMVLKTDAQGDTLWARQYRSDSADITVRLRDMEMMDGGGVMVLGDLVQDGREDLLLTRLTPSGALSWSKRIGKSEPLNEQGVTMAPASNGDYFLAGKSSNQNASAEDLYVLQVDSAGNVKWARTYIPLGTDESLEPEDIESTSDGGAIVAGLLDTSKLGVDPLLVRIAPGGDTLWTRIYGGTDRDVPRSVVEDPNGGYYLGANSNNKASSSGDLILYKTKENGDPQWGRAIGNPLEYEWAETMIRAANGDFLYAAIRENRFAYFRASGTGDNPCITSTINPQVKTFPLFISAATDIEEPISLSARPVDIAVKDSSFVEDTICPTSSGISEPAGRHPLTVHPNPSSGRFTVFHGERADMPYTVVDLTGRTVANGVLRGKRTTLDLSGEANGLYLFRVRNRVQRLLKE